MILFYLLGSVILIILLSTKFKFHPVSSLISVSFILGLLLKIEVLDIIKFIFDGVINSILGIGLIIFFSCVIGQCLKQSSSLNLFSQLILKTFKDKTLSSLNIIGLFIGSVVFCDSAFLVLSGITKTISSTAAYSLNSLNISLAGGLYTSHNLIPPTPGPIAILNNFNSMELIGDTIIYGFLVSIPSSLISLIFASKIINKTKIKINYKSDISYREVFLPFLVIFIPLLIISINTITELIGFNLSREQIENIKTLSNPNFALFVGMSLSFFLPQVRNIKKLIFLESIKDFYPIIFLTSAGSAFGNIIKNSDLIEFLPLFFGNIDINLLNICLISFILGAIIKTSQGSSTSAMIISSSLIFPLISQLHLEAFGIIMTTLSIGAGSMMISHVNDSYFWIVSKKSDMSLKNSLMYFSTMTVFQSIGTFLFIIFLVKINSL
jgi:GntP family gluconate:H+ symporter